jgi:hypothetical protein
LVVCIKITLKNFRISSEYKHDVNLQHPPYKSKKITSKVLAF